MIFNDPFPHYIVYDIIDKHMLDKIKSEFEQKPHGDYYINADYSEINDYLQNFAWTELVKHRTELEKITHNKRNKLPCNENDSFFRIMVKVMDPGTKHHSIHLDSDWKQLTTIVYVSDENTGTKFYTDNNKLAFYKEVEWKKNKGYSFIPSSTSWHDFENSIEFNEPRIVIMFTLCNKRYYR